MEHACPGLRLLICPFRADLWRPILPLVRSPEAVRDIDAAVDLIRRRTGKTRVSLFGWATSGQWAGYYATLHSGKLSHLILLNALYGVNAPDPVIGHGSDMEDPAHPGRLNPNIGAYRCNAASSLLAGGAETFH
jgi:pimeloyl-ACP methyl ester carboxylesterase